MLNASKGTKTTGGEGREGRRCPAPKSVKEPHLVCPSVACPLAGQVTRSSAPRGPAFLCCASPLIIAPLPSVVPATCLVSHKYLWPGEEFSASRTTLYPREIEVFPWESWRFLGRSFQGAGGCLPESAALTKELRDPGWGYILKTSRSLCVSV